jgi:hypothetical protein
MHSQEIQSALCRSRRGEEICIENLLKCTRLAFSMTPAFLSATLAIWLGFFMNGSLKLPGTYPPGTVMLDEETLLNWRNSAVLLTEKMLIVLIKRID